MQRGKLRIYQGLNREALALLEPPLPAEPPYAALAATRSSLLAIAYARTGNPMAAQQTIQDAQKQCRDELSRADVRLAQGIIDVEGGRLADAERDFQLSLSSARATGDKFQQAQALVSLGVVALRQEHYDDALDRSNQAMVVASVISAHLALEKAAGNVGWAFYKLGDFRRALANAQLAEQEARALGSPIDQVNWLNDSGLSQYRLGDLNAAKSSYEKSYQLARSIQNYEEIGDALVALAQLSLQSGDLSAALAQSREAQRIAEQRGNSDDSLKASLVEALVVARQGDSSAAEHKLLNLLHLQQTSSNKQSVRWEIEGALARLYADTGEVKSADTWFRRATETFHRQRSSVIGISSRLPFLENGSSLYLEYMEHLIQEGRVEDALWVLDQSSAETLAEGLQSPRDAITNSDKETKGLPNAVARNLHATVLVYCLRPATSYLWAITPKRWKFFRLPGKEVILPLVESHNLTVRSSKDVLSQESGAGLALYRYLVEPVRNLIPPNGKVFIVADQGLDGLNFETLPTSTEQPHFWIEDVDVINAKSLALLARSYSTRLADAAPKGLLLMGDPVYNGREYEKLPHAAEEVAGVAEHFSPDRRLVYTGQRATPAAYQNSRPGDFAYIHFVAHGTASEMNALDSAIILSTRAGETESYKLYAREILDQRLHADLVTISSCYGSGVRSYSGEGLVGLAWAFLRAGSHGVIGALWEVNDISTPRLMSDLYTGLARGAAPDTALRAAKLSMIHRGGVFRKPFYWAPFQLYAGT